MTKSWNDSNNQDGNRPNSILVQLNSVNGEELVPVGEPVEILASEDWTYTWTGLPVNADGTAIEYTVEELNVSEDYTVSVDDADHGNIMMTNSYTPETIEIPVTKVWDDAENQDGERPSDITLNLLNDRSEIVKQAVVQDQESNEWNYTFTDLPRFENGTEINYSVTEDRESNYSTTIEDNAEIENGVVITNTFTPGKTSATVNKTWNDGNNQDGNRPDSIEVQLTANGENHGDPVVLTEETDWTYTWSDLDTKADGEEINYSVTELNVPEEYEALVNDADHGAMTITNSYSPELIEIPVQKVWDDKDNQDKVRPDSVIVNLLADGEEIQAATITEAADWKHEFTDLPKYKAGEEIIYTLTEDTIEDYSTSIETTETDTGLDSVVTNLYTPDETSVTATKNWQDADNQENDRPEAIELQLIKIVDGEREAVGSSEEVSVENNWTFTWDNLDRNSDGEKIEYTVEEVIDEEHGAYEVTVNNEDEGNIIITNSRTYETEHKVVKGWADEDNKDGIRPDSIDVQLLQDGKELGKPVTLSEENNWIHEWDNLEKYNHNNEAYTYTVKEVEVPEGYIAESKLNDEYPNTSFITNTHEPAEPEEPTDPPVDPEEPTEPEEPTDPPVDPEEPTEPEEPTDPPVDPEEPTEPTKPSVSVGDYVWIDENRDGLQDDTDTPLKGVELRITDADGNPVIDVYGNPVGPVKTDENGYYTFDNLPINSKYIVMINRKSFESLYPELVPTIQVDGNREADSSTWTAMSIFLDEDGQRDPTLDFGFVVSSNEDAGVVPGKDENTGTDTNSEPSNPESNEENASEEQEEESQKKPEEKETAVKEETSDKEKEDEEALPDTGIAYSGTIAAAAAILLIAGGSILFFARRRN